MKKFAVVGVFILAAASLVAVTLPAWSQEHTKDSLDTVKKSLAAKTAVLIDVREKVEWDGGHLADAKLLSLSGLKKDATAKEVKDLLPKDKPIYLHCASGKRCLVAAEILRKQGYDARALKAGYQELVKSGFTKAEK